MQMRRLSHVAITYLFQSTGPDKPSGPGEPDRALAVDAYDSVNLEIVAVHGTPPNMTVLCNMGNLSGLGHFNGQTLGSVVGQFPLAPFDSVIHNFSVTGPEFSVQLTGGPPNTKVNFEAWIFLK